jgi:hypothetical protein
MRLIHNVTSISKLILIILLLVSFILGALLSYVWTMGGYYHLPSQANVTIESVEFYVENATFFNVTLLNPSYSLSAVAIEQILVSTNDGLLHNVTDTLPSLPFPLAPSNSQTFKAYWNWGNYTGQTVNIVASVADEESGATFQKRTPLMNLTIASIDFYPEISVGYFNITVQSMGCKTYVDITKILVNGADVSNVTTPVLAPYPFNPNSTVTFSIRRNWADLQDKNVTIAVQTLQGYNVYKTVQAPLPVTLSINVAFNETISTTSFNVIILNAMTSPTDVDISGVTVNVAGNVIQIQNWTASPSSKLVRASPVLIVCQWNWPSYQGQVATILVSTVQGFQATSPPTTIP